MENHQEKQDIFDKYAKSKSNLFHNFKDLVSQYSHEKQIDRILDHIFAACDLVQEEQQKRIKERISNSEYQKGHYIDISSITNPENKIQ